jgi:peptidoglycan/LPS O-acetylase OafA/YrhL
LGSQPPDGLATAPRRFGRSLGIDSIRAVLALWVLSSHAIYWTPPIYRGSFGFGLLTRLEWRLRQGQSVVDEAHPAVLSFIVLSGYCVHRNGLRATSTSVRQFALRRIFRIVPVYL